MSRSWSCCSLLIALLAAGTAHARLDIEDRGPVLDAGRAVLRVTNVGVLGNAYFDIGRSFDPSFEYPRGSGNELLHHAELWVGAIDEDRNVRVSGGPLLEWRPSLAARDSVIKRNAGEPGSRWRFDDDRDGRVDEETLNGFDDDGDGRIDEDLGMVSQQLLAADYSDDRPEAVAAIGDNGERHLPLGLSVHQEVLGWSVSGHDNVAGLRFTVTNTSQRTLHDVWLGLNADLDVRGNGDRAGHLDDVLTIEPFDIVIPHGDDTLSAFLKLQCNERIHRDVAVLRDASAASGAPLVALLPLTHTTDPLGFFVNDAFPGVREARAQARAPRRDSTFRWRAFSRGLPPRQGGPPLIDIDRYAAMTGDYPGAGLDDPRDYSVLLSCGSFRTLAPGQSLSFEAALVAIPNIDSVASALTSALMLWRGTGYDFIRNGRDGDFSIGTGRVNGHESCYEPPPGIEFNYDPHCLEKFLDDPEMIPYLNLPPPTFSEEVHYSAGHCVWTDLDCEMCTGNDGLDFTQRWQLDLPLPPQPASRVTVGDRHVRIEWDNGPELALAAGDAGSRDWKFAGYKLYRLEDWRRKAVLPEPEQWQRLAYFRNDAAAGGRSLASVTMADVPATGTRAGMPVYPVGRYRFDDDNVLDGFDYLYVLTAVMRYSPLNPIPPSLTAEFESPFIVRFGDKVTPRLEASATGSRVWVVPNPYRARAEWERQPVPGDAFTRHIDFMGLPRARCTVRIYTLAGDLVATVDHDGSRGDGQASWNLISRNGQDVESGIYLFTVSSPLGHQTGRFVLMR